MKIKKLLTFCLSFCLSLVYLFLVGCGTSGGGTPQKISYIAGTTLNNSSVVRWIGRTEYKDEQMFTYYTATGFTVKFSGTKLYVTYTATNTDSEKNRPYFVCMVDGESPEEGESFCLTKATQTVLVAENLASGEHTATVLKRSEPENSLTSISEIFTDGKFLKPEENDGPNVQIIGSSGITGHGCLGTTGQAWTTANSSPFSSFGYLSASAFGGECQFVSASAMGMCWTFRGVDTMANAYDAVGMIAEYNANGSTKSVKATSKKWNHAKWTPDIVIANIGGNDWNAHISSQTGANRVAAENQFKTAIESLLNHIHNLYPNAVVVWAVNSKTSGNGKLANEVIQTLSFSNKIKVVEIDNTKDGADNHASAATHAKSATAIIEAIKTFGFKTK